MVSVVKPSYSRMVDGIRFGLELFDDGTIANIRKI